MNNCKLLKKWVNQNFKYNKKSVLKQKTKAKVSFYNKMYFLLQIIHQEINWNRFEESFVYIIHCLAGEQKLIQ